MTQNFGEQIQRGSAYNGWAEAAMTKSDDKITKLPAVRLEPLMLTHLALTRDVEQQKEWREQIDSIRQAEEIDRERDPQLKQLLRKKEVWEQVKDSGRLGAILTMGLGAAWMSWLIPAYAFGWGFGWSALAYLLPVPFTWRLAKRLFRRSALSGMREYRPNASVRRRFRNWFRAALRTYASGFAFGFSLTFVQGLISWFFTPAPTLGLELLLDAMVASWAGMVVGGFSVALVPFMTRPARGILPPGAPLSPRLLESET